MSNYDFSTLSPLDFEKLACDLMTDYFKDEFNFGHFQSFKAGRDQGIDILLSTPENDYEIIGQVKHYHKSAFSKLKYDLEKTEKDKVFQLNPKSYLIITSQELSQQNKKEIKEIFKPYIKSLNNIFGREDLNRLIKNNKKIEEKHYKLWFSSSIIFNKILNYKFHGRRKEFSNNVLKRKFRVFVITGDFIKAQNTLKENKFIILTGEPGVGKSTLSEMIIYDYIKNDFELNIIYDDIKDIEISLIDDNSKQIFYFDDFLGHTQAEINKSKSAEISLIRIINRIEDLENKYLILNTRKFILTSFIQDSERLQKFNPLRSEAKIELDTYSYSTKRRMLDNHIHESSLSIDQIEIITDLSHDICRHNNFTPRIIEFFTGSEVLKLNKTEYKTFIESNLENPKTIWNHAYMNQISDYDRFLLNTLFSFKGEGSINQLNEAYQNRLDFEVKNNNYIKPIDSFNDSLRRMNNGFIVVSDYEPKYVSYINPSLQDFLKNFIQHNKSEIERILLASRYIEQWYNFYTPFITPKNEIPQDLKTFFKNQHSKLFNNVNESRDYFLAAIFIFHFIEESEYKITIGLIESITNWDFLIDDTELHFYSKKFLNNSKSNVFLNFSISNLKIEFFYNILINENSLKEFMYFSKLIINHFGFDFFIFFRQEEILSLSLLESLNHIFKQDLEEKYNYLKNENVEKDIHLEIIDEIENHLEFINNNIFKKFNIDYYFIKHQDWNEFTNINLIESDYRNTVRRVDYDYDYLADNYYYQEEYNYEENPTKEYLNLDELIEEFKLKKAQNDINLFDEKEDLPF
ncbi:MAG: hypothetical protein ACOH2D_01085 [Gelidibacter sp.]